MLSVTIGSGVVQQKLLLEETSKKDSSNQDKSAYKLVRPGDVVYNKMRAWQGAIGVSDYTGIISPAYVVQRPRKGLAHYFHYLLRTPTFAREAERWSYGITSDMWSLRPEHFKMIYGCFPPLTEQHGIVRFLNHIEEYFNRYICAKQKLIELLEEQKCAIINHAMTRGIDPCVRMKPSGIEWLGDVPEGWNVARLKVALSRPTRNGLFKRKDQFGNGVPLINVADAYEDHFRVNPSSLERVRATPDEINRYGVRSGDIFFVRSSLKIEGTGRTVMAVDCASDTVFECHLVQVRPDSSKVDSRYLVLQLNSDLLRTYLISRCNVVTMATISQSVISACPILIPPIAEQERLVQWTDTQLSHLRQAIEHVKRQIVYIGEYRTRLIFDVVTGKLDVRQIRDQLPDHLKTVGRRDDASMSSESLVKDEPSF